MPLKLSQVDHFYNYFLEKYND
ncbi:hypothetical protein CY0110_16452 [Crocosphaera chwakensis CCY0110]|uniref:Uncharacterized protein n=1 Tax=Crocosphaera chwakensis CCY0110 TaxID=391612 RepID=A3IHX2_9CHRO|nr:hypothetical protein CY0110_16452 [Crocosphaera chwakensis CCY0110]